MRRKVGGVIVAAFALFGGIGWAMNPAVADREGGARPPAVLRSPVLEVPGPFLRELP